MSEVADVGRAQLHANWQAMFAGIPDFRAELIRSVRRDRDQRPQPLDG